jgi:hypothetical protein
MLMRTVQIKTYAKKSNVFPTVNKTREAAVKVSHALSHVTASYSKPFTEG